MCKIPNGSTTAVKIAKCRLYLKVGMACHRESASDSILYQKDK